MSWEIGKAGDIVELADKTAGFTDVVTGFDISRDQQKKLEDPIGDRTQQAIMSGGLLIVQGKAKGKKAKDESAAEETPAEEAPAQE